MNKIESRRQAFEDLMKKLVKIANEYKNMKAGLLKILHSFLTKNIGKNDSITKRVSVINFENSMSGKIKTDRESFHENDEEGVKFLESLTTERIDLMNDKEYNKDFAAAVEGFEIEEDVKETLFQVDVNHQETSSSLRFEKKNSAPVKERNSSKLEPIKESKSVKNKELSGNIIFKFSTQSKKWTKYFAKINGSELLLFNSMLDNHYDAVLSLYGAGIFLEDENKLPVIKISHKLEDEPAIIAINSQNSVELREITGNWFSKLEKAANDDSFIPKSQMQFQNRNWDSAGKVLITVNNLQGIVSENNNNLYFVRVSHIPFAFKTMKVIYKEIMTFDQKIFIPLTDHFFPIVFEIFLISHTGWLSEHKKEEMVGSCKLSAADIIDFSRNSVANLTLAVTPVTKGEKVERKEKEKKKPVKQIILGVSVENRSKIDSLISDQAPGFNEGIPISTDNYNKDELKIGFLRVRRVISSFLMAEQKVNVIFRFKYPRFSYLWMIVFFSFLSKIFAIYGNFFHANLVQFLILIIMMLGIFNHPKIQTKAKGFMEKNFYSHLNPHYYEPKVFTISQSNTNKYGNIERVKMKIKDTQSLTQKYKEMKRSLATLENLLKSFTNSCEKFKNLLIWSEPRRSMIAFIFLFFLFALISKISFRFFFNAVIIFKFVDCRNFYKMAPKHNTFIALVVLEDFFENNYPELKEEIMLKNQDFPLSNANFMKKLSETFRSVLKLDINEEFIKANPKPNDFLNTISFCSVKLRIQKAVLTNSLKEKCLRLKVKYMTKGMLARLKIINFISNIPSDYYRLLYPSPILNEEFS